MVDDKLNTDMSEEDAKRSDREAVLPDNAPNDHTVKVNVRPSGRMLRLVSYLVNLKPYPCTRPKNFPSQTSFRSTTPKSSRYNFPVFALS